MRKRRVLALLLALSLVVSGNGMTVLAAEQGADMSVFASEGAETEQDTPIEDKGVEDSGEIQKEQTPEDDGQTDEEKKPSAEDGAPAEQEKEEEQDKAQEGETPENPDAAEKTDPGKDDGQTPAQDEEQNGGQQEDGTETQEPVADEQPSVSENDVEEQQEPEEEVIAEENGIRMMSFTDAAGLQITFDANAAQKNAEKVTISEDGVLTAVDDSVTGVIDLRQEEFTQIGEEAFQGKVNVTYVMLPKTVISIGKDGFKGCAALKGISIPSKLEIIGESAFENCEKLTQIAIPNSVVTIGANAFKGDSRLFMVNMVSADYSKLKSVGANAFEGCFALEFFCSDNGYHLPDSIERIEENAFKGCSRISEVHMGDGITYLGSSAYQGCTGIKEIEISTDLSTISGSAFSGCTNLIKLEFKTKVRAPKTTIESLAFENCTRLMNVEFPQKVAVIRTDAFKGCTALQRIYIKNDDAELGDNAFPNGNTGLCIVGSKGSAAEVYAGEAIRFIPIDEEGRKDYYTYTKKLIEPMGDGEIKLTVTKEATASAKDINTISTDGQKGVLAGTICYVMISLGKYQGQNGQKPAVRLVPGSLKCNGQEIEYDKNIGCYFFKMPNGGATITAEFETTTTGSMVEGTAESIEGRLSSDVNYDYERNIAYMQEGQSAKFYLINNYEGRSVRIPASKITYRIEQYSKKNVASVDKEGEVKALKEGTTIVEAVVNTESGEVVKDVTVVVKKTTGIDRIVLSLKKGVYNDLTIEKGDDETMQGVSIPASKVGARQYDFEISADAFSAEDDTALKVAFNWVSSDSKVAKVKKSSTQSGASVNQITIPRGADGEATITVSATGQDGRKVTQGFVVSVRDYSPRLSVSKIKVNPKHEGGATTINVIDAYGREVDNTKIIEAYDRSGSRVGGLTFEFVKKEGIVSTYKVKALGKEQRKYEVELGIYVKIDGVSKPYKVPLTVEVKESEPKPTVSFGKKAEKINLFLAKDGVEIKPVIGKLGDDVVSEYSLEPLTEVGHKNYEDDKLFVENFQIDAKKGVITQKADNLLKNKAGKPVLTGYLVLKFEGYGDWTKKCKITIPTKTTAPSYVLDRTTDTFGTGFGKPQEVYLQLLGKKTKKPIEWDDGFQNGLTVDTDSTTFQFAQAELVPVDQKVDGKNTKCVGIKVTVPANPQNKTGKLVMKVRNSAWAEGREFKYTYNIKIDTKPHKLSLKKATITLNAKYPERKETFEVVSNHRDVVIEGEQKFEAQSTEKNQAEYNKLVVDCKDGKGTVSLKAGGQDIKAGNYKYVYTYKNKEGKENKVTLTVKVNKAMPTVTLKGTNAFNLMARDGEFYVEVSEMTVAVKNLPDTQKYFETEEVVTPEKPEEPKPPTEDGDDKKDPDESGGGENDKKPDEGGETEPDSGKDDQTEGPETTSLLALSSEPQVTIKKEKNPAFYSLDTEETFKSLEITTKKYTALRPLDYFDFEWDENEEGAGGKIRISLKKEMDTTTYTLRMTPAFKNNENTIKTAKPVSFKIKVYNASISSVKLSAKGKMNLLDRPVMPVAVERDDKQDEPEEFPYTEKNGIRYTPAVANLKDTIKEVRVLRDEYPSEGDYAVEEKQSDLFEAHITKDKKSFYLVPKQGAELENNKQYKVYIWLLMDNYKFGTSTGNGIYTATPVKFKTAQILPKVKTDETSANLFMSSKSYEAVFTVQKADEKALGAIEGIAFGEKDEKANDSFEVRGVKKDDGSLEVRLKLKNGVTYGCNTTNKVKMYIKFTGQGINTDGTPITMNVKINK